MMTESYGTEYGDDEGPRIAERGNVLCFKPWGHEYGLQIRRGIALVLMGVLLGSVLGALVGFAAASGEGPPQLLAMTTGTSAGSLGDLNTVDGAGVTLTEAVTGAGVGTAWLKPTGDNSIQWNYAFGCIPNTHAGCVDDDPIHDGNTSYLTGNGNQDDQYNTEDWGTRPLDVAITNVHIFSWARKNQSTDPGYFLRIRDDPTHACDYAAVPLTQAFQNWSGDSETTMCQGTPWTTSAINDLLMDSDCSGCNDQALATATSVGIIVSYTDYDYTLLGTFTWHSINPGPGTVTLELAGAITDAGDNFAVQVQECGTGTWTTLESSQFAVSTSQRSYHVTGRICSGDLAVRIVDVDPTGEDQAALLLDQLSLSISGDNDNNGPWGNALVLGCSPGIQIHCTVTLNPGVDPNIAIVNSTWWTNGVYQGKGSPDGWYLQVKDFLAPFPAGATNITVRTVLNNGAVIDLYKIVYVDNTWLIFAVFAILVAVILAALIRYARKREKVSAARSKQDTEASEKRREEDLWARVIK